MSFARVKLKQKELKIELFDEQKIDNRFIIYDSCSIPPSSVRLWPVPTEERCHGNLNE